MDLKVSVEAPEILGTGGGLRRVGPDLAESFVVLNGDVVSTVDLGLLRSSLDSLPEGPRSVLALRSPEPGQAYSKVEMDREGRVVNLAGLASSPPVGDPFEGTHFTGIHAMNRAALGLLPAAGSPCVVRNLYTDLVSERRVAGILHAGLWLELGNPQDYLEANLAMLRRQVVTPLDTHTLAAGPDLCEIHPSAELHPGTWLGEGVCIGAQVQVGEGVILGAGSVLSSGARIRESVVWDGCEVPKEARFERVVVHDSGVLRVPRT
jgi:NDP-sugar pyrophosphorylase family protein